MFLMPVLGIAWWIFIIWLVCGLVILIFDRLAVADNCQIWESDRPLGSALAYLILILAGPLILSGLFGWMAWESVSRLWRESSVAHPSKDKSRHETEDSVLVDLVRRRAAVDPHLNGAEIDQWPMCQFWPTPEAKILDLVRKYHQLRAAGAPEDLIWDKMETYRADFGTRVLPNPCSLVDFIAHRLALEHPAYYEFGPSFLISQ